jgi:hypothetical protein
MASQVDSELSDLFSGDVEDFDFQLSMPSSPSLATQLQGPNFTASSQASSEAGSSRLTRGLSVSNQKAKGRTSQVWNHCSFPPDAIVHNARGKSIWQCKYCFTILQEKGGTGHMITHLREKCKINLQTSHEARIERYQQGIEESFRNVINQNPDYKRRRLNTTTYTESVDPSILEDLYVKWITSCGVSFNMVGREEFRS